MKRLYISAVVLAISATSLPANAVKNANFLNFSYDEYSDSLFSGKVVTHNWNSQEGIKRFNQSKFKDDFFRLAHHVKHQEEGPTCGLASAATIMGAIYEQNNQKFPIVKYFPIYVNGKYHGLEYRLWTEKNFVNEETDKIVDRRALLMQYPHDKSGNFMGGIDMDELAKMFKVHDVNVKVIHVEEADDGTVNNFRKVVKDIVTDNKKFLVANFSRGYAGAEMGGHYSPIAAYDQETDSILIMDVAAHKNPWIWVSIEDFVKSMNSKNYSGKEYRGYMIINA